MRAWAELSFMAVPKSKPGQFPDCEDKPRRSPQVVAGAFFCARHQSDRRKWTDMKDHPKNSHGNDHPGVDPCGLLARRRAFASFICSFLPSGEPPGPGRHPEGHDGQPRRLQPL